MDKTYKWKCTICGVVVEGENPPESCPVCGVGPEMFEKVEEPKEELANNNKTSKWKCMICGVVVEGENPPESCPVCGVGPEMFEKVEEVEKPNVSKVLESTGESNNNSKISKWKCTVCGEIIEGVDPPETCPVCGVGPEMFVKVEEEKEPEIIINKDEKIVIIGGSGAGMSAAVEIRKRNPYCSLTIISKENVKGYYRPQLTKMLSNEKVSIESMTIKDDKWYEENNINLLLNKLVTKINSANKNIVLDDGKEIEYTKLIIASGAESFAPPIPGKDKEGVFTLRYVTDEKAIREYAKGKRTAAVIGGGVLGLEAANELKNMGLSVTVIEMVDRILPRQLDSDASIILEEAVKNAGVNFKKKVGTKEILGDSKVTGILLDNGETVDAEVVVISTGVRANSSIAEGNNIEIKRAIVVNEKMETTEPQVYACGDCAEYNGINYALWSEAIEQGKVAGINAAGGNSVYKTIVPSTTLVAFGTSVFSIGDVSADPNSQYETYEYHGGNNFKKLYFKNGNLAGGILIGDISKTVLLMDGFEKGKKIGEMIEKIKS